MNPYVLIPLIAMCLSSIVAVYTWYRQRQQIGALAFTLMLVGGLIWSGAQALGLMSPDQDGKLFWANAQFIGVYMTATMWFVFAWEYTNQRPFLNRRMIALLAIVPVLLQILTWTNDSHHLFRISIMLDTSGPFPALVTERGIAYIVHLLYTYGLLFGGVIFFVYMAFFSSSVYRRQALIFVVAASMVSVANLIFVLNLTPVQLDPTPIGLSLAAAVIALGRVQFGILDLVPLARSTVVNNLQIGLVAVNAEQKIMDINPAARTMLGCGTSNLIGQPVDRILQGDFQALNGRLADSVDVKTELFTTDLIVYEVTISTLYDRSSTAAGRILMLRDITEAKRREEVIHKNERWLQMIIDQIPGLIWTVDQNLYFTASTGHGLESLGLESGQVVGMSLYDYFYTDDPDFEPILQHRRALEGESTSFEFSWNGQTFEVHVEPLRDMDGVILGCLGLAINITERKAMEQQALDLAIEKQHVEILTRFIEDVSHDFKTPLSTINTSRYVLAKFAHTDKEKYHLEVIHKQVQYLNRLLDSILTLSHLDRGDYMEKHSIQVNQLLSDLSNSVQPLIDAKQQTLLVSFDSNLPPIMANARALHTAFSNLIYNAIRYTPEHGRISIQTSGDADWVQICFDDTGKGIKKEKLQQIFERFYRVEESRNRDTGGSGLGLAIAKKIVEGHQGKIEVESTPSVGSTFTVMLPVNPESVDSDDPIFNLR